MIGSSTTLYVPKGSKAAYESAKYWNYAKNIIEYSDPRFTASLSAEFGTFCSTANLDFTDVEGLKAYTVTGYSPTTGKVTLTRVEKVPAGTGLVLRGTAGQEYTIPEAEDTDILSNLLVGVTEDMELSPTDGAKTNFILANDADNGIGFYAVSSTGTLKAGKAYLQLPTTSLQATVRGYTFDFDESTTSVTDIEPRKATTTQFFDMKGQRVTMPGKGIYIVNGKKIMK